MVFGQMTFSLGCLPAASQLASARHLPKPLKITFALSSINCYEVKTLKIVNGRTANVFICPSSINRPGFFSSSAVGDMQHLVAEMQKTEISVTFFPNEAEEVFLYC